MRRRLPRNACPMRTATACIRVRGSMASSLPNGRRGQLLAIALTLTVAAAVWTGVLAPLFGWYAEQTQHLEQRRALARKMAEVAETLPALQTRAARDDANGPAPSTVLEGETDAI